MDQRQTRQCTCQHNIEVRSSNIYCLKKAISVTCSNCVSVTMVIHKAMPVHRTILSSVACPDLPDFPTLSHKWNDFRENVIKYKKCFDFL